MLNYIKAEAYIVLRVCIKSKILFQVDVFDIGIKIDLTSVAFKTNIEIIIAVDERSIGEYFTVQYTVPS